jgi:hypothetical protein
MEPDRSKFPRDDLVKARRFATEYYRTLGRVRSPALNHEWVAFNSKGICHILYKAAHNTPEIVERLFCLQYAKAIIEDSEAEIEYRCLNDKEYLKENGNYRLCQVVSQYWTFKKGVAPELIIKVVVRQVEQGQKHFYSIMAHVER